MCSETYFAGILLGYKGAGGPQRTMAFETKIGLGNQNSRHCQFEDGDVFCT